ncbi:SPP1 family predicted phage head-tail adaptor [Ochrobactrum sp. RH1CCR137]|nr:MULTISPECIES: phage head closure protein [unclassified Ochrobactrum]MBA8844382.1 SPP1 family predicted phage head-tail adaptor [Ochrobactrum sp. RH1CCR137]MBA8855738.1 SPP1 family predicted phage head-tail adaptor [Ochrobactrum sp. RH1CCR134]
MRAGKLDRVIVIQRHMVIGDDGMGNEILGWGDLVTLRAQIVTASTEEFIRSYGIANDAVMIFRTRYYPSIDPADRIRFDGRLYDIKEVTLIGRNRGLELRCVRLAE